MRYVGAIFFLLLFAADAAAVPMPTVKFTPQVKIYECPPVFKHKSECLVTEKKLEPVKLWLNIEVLNQSMGQWTHQETLPVPSSFYVIVLRGPGSGGYEYSVSTETGVTGTAMPFSNGRVEFTDATTPASLGVSGVPVEKDGKKYITELRLTEFHGRIWPNKK